MWSRSTQSKRYNNKSEDFDGETVRVRKYGALRNKGMRYGISSKKKIYNSLRKPNNPLSAQPQFLVLTRFLIPISLFT